jgi:hypothetical protein
MQCGKRDRGLQSDHVGETDEDMVANWSPAEFVDRISQQRSCADERRAIVLRGHERVGRNHRFLRRMHLLVRVHRPGLARLYPRERAQPTAQSEKWTIFDKTQK